VGMKIMINKKFWMSVLYLAIAFILGLAVYAFLFSGKNKFDLPEEGPDIGLGMPGALCGGEKRLPCLPGNICEIKDKEKDEGICVHITDEPGKAIPPQN